MTWISKMRALCLGLLCVPALAGCGGSDHGPSAPTQPALGPLLVSGVVQVTPLGAALNGYTVTFDANPKLTATTDAGGAFTLSVPRSAVTGTDTLLVTAPGGALVDTIPVAPNAAAPTTFNAGTLAVSPPAAPAPGF